MYKIAVLGDRDSILGFKSLGIDVFAVTGPAEALGVLKKLAAGDYGVIYMTEELVEELADPVNELNKRFLPVVVPIPNSKGVLGTGMKQIRIKVEKAIGADILFRKDG